MTEVDCRGKRKASVYKNGGSCSGDCRRVGGRGRERTCKRPANKKSGSAVMTAEE